MPAIRSRCVRSSPLSHHPMWPLLAELLPIPTSHGAVSEFHALKSGDVLQLAAEQVRRYLNLAWRIISPKNTTRVAAVTHLGDALELASA